MKVLKSLFFLLLFSGIALQSFGQCTIDYSYNPIGANYGLHPDTLPDGVMGQVYNQDLTFVLPLDTTDGGMTVTFTDFHIVSINLPIGLTWQCSNFANACHYDPAVDQYGCVNVSGIPLQAGSYNIDVELIATHSLSSLAGTETVLFTLPLEVLPDTSSSNNAGFAMVGSSGCSSVQVSFSNNNPGMASYAWDFGNGNMSNAEDPMPQVYNAPGVYTVQYNAYSSIVSSYFLTDIEVVSASGWGGDMDDGFGSLDPDPYIYVKDQSGNTVFSSSVLVNDDFPVSWTTSNMPLNNETYTVEVWDQDGTWTNDDFLGSVTFQGFSNSGTATDGNVTLNYTILEIPPTPLVSVDTVYVYDTPSVANVVYDTLNTVLYTDSSYFGMQWYYYNSPIPNATDSFVIPTLSGLYSVVGISEYGCTSISDDVLVVICDSVYQPILQVSGMDAWMLDSALYDDVQWYSSGLLMLGDTFPVFAASESGSYSITATDTFGCAYSSDEVVICDGNQQPVLGVNGMNLWVADSANYVSFYWMQGGGSLANAASEHQAFYSGMYSVQTEDVFGCEYTSAEMLICDEDFEPNVYVFNDVLYTTDSVGFSMQWYLDGSPIASANSAAIQMLESGSYTLLLTDQYGCSYESEDFEYSDIGEGVESFVFLAPNPARDEVSVSGIGSKRVAFQIMSVEGVLLKEGQMKNSRIDIADLSVGVYVVRLKLEDSWEQLKLLKLNY